MSKLSEEATAYFDAHLAEDPATIKMLSRLNLVADELEDAGLGRVIDAAKFSEALEQCDVASCAELPFELDEPVRQIIDGAKSKPAMEEHCTSAETRQAAVVLNTVRRISSQKTSYNWADEFLRQTPLKTYAQVCLSVIDDELARIPLALNNELRFLPRLDAQQSPDTNKEHQVVVVTSLVLFWTEDGQIHCGMSERYGAGWNRVVEFARREGYPVHMGFQGEVLDDARLEEMLAESLSL
jgi:hypothetical protein